MNKNVIKGIVVAAAVLVAVVAWMLYSPANNANFPDGTDWLCLNPKCNTTTTLSIKQLAQYNEDHVGEPVKCPKCGTGAVRAEKCSHCAKSFPMSPHPQRLGPFGHGNRRPVLCCRGVTVAAPPRRCGKSGDHLQLTVRQGDTILKCIAFGCAPLDAKLTPGTTNDLAVEPTLNEFNGRANVELEVKDVSFG